MAQQCTSNKSNTCIKKSVAFALNKVTQGINGNKKSKIRYKHIMTKT